MSTTASWPAPWRPLVTCARLRQQRGRQLPLAGLCGFATFKMIGIDGIVVPSLYVQLDVETIAGHDRKLSPAYVNALNSIISFPKGISVNVQ